jgi:hypothetical protein
LEPTPSSLLQRVQDATYDVERIAIHEVGHVGGVLEHNTEFGHPQSDDKTVMTIGPPQNPDLGYNTHTLLQCDEATMQLMYDVATTNGPYAGCFDHFAGHGVQGLISAATASAPVTSGCYGAGLAINGRLAIQTTSAYEHISGNPLTSRTVFFDRKLHSSSTWTLDYASSVATNSAGNNWTHTFSVAGSSGSVTYDFRAHYKGETGVDPVYSSVVSLSWSNPC